MRGGIWVLNIFAAVWSAGGIIAGHGPVWLAVLAVAISVALLFWASRQSVGTDNPIEGSHVGRVVGIASAIEGVAIFIVANVLGNMHLQAFLLPAVAIIVGLHFIPLARWIPVRIYYWTGAGLIAVGMAGIAVPEANRAIVTGIAAAIVLWLSGIRLARYGRG